MRALRHVLLAAALAAPVFAQSHPDFSGTWVEDESARKTTVVTPPGAKGIALPPRDIVVTQTADTLTTEMTFMSQVVRYVYHLDGQQSVNHNGANTQTTRSAWEGQKLVTGGTSYSVTSAGEFNWVIQETRWLDPKGAMITETTHKDENGKVDVVTRVFHRKR